MNKTRTHLVVVALVISILAAPTTAGASAPTPREPGPGEFITLKQTIPVNIVFIGFDKKSIDKQALLAELPATYVPVVRFPGYYGLPGRDLGLRYTFDYHLRHAPARFEDRFFDYLSDIGTQGNLTFYQQAYNDMANNVLDVSDTALYVDAPSVEAWLAGNAHQLRIDVKRSYTVFFVNWHSRDDFQFHIYTKTDEPEPDSGRNLGADFDGAKMVAWGGTHSRTWFYDLSAGPEYWAGNFDVDNDDLDFDGQADYRIPPIWEYAEGGYRDPSALSIELGIVTRWVAINLLFTTSPTYDPLVTAPGVGGGKVVHMTMFEDDPGSSGLDWIHPEVIRNKLRDFEPYYAWDVALVDQDPMDAAAERAFLIWSGVLAEDDCWNDFGYTFAELFCSFDLNRDTYIPDYDDEDYVVGGFPINTTDANMGNFFGINGYALDNRLDGTQSFVFMWSYPLLKSVGLGFTSVTVHEVGHHIGLSHPHDGYDSEFGMDYGASGNAYFAWLGDESHSPMSYMLLTTGFGQFDRDNMYRWETAGYLNEANALLDDVLADPDAHRVRRQIRAAQQSMERSMRSFNRWDYLQAATYAHQAHDAVLEAANRVGVSAPTAPATLRLSTQPIVLHKDDPIRYPEFEP
jgi:hypothetical protein